MPQDIKAETDQTPERARVTGLENVRASARELANRVRDTGLSIGEFAAEELSFAVSLAEDLRDRTVSAEVLKEVRGYPTVNSFRNSTHRVVDLGFDAVAIGVKIGTDLTDQVLAPRDQRTAIANA
ncbi:hypothetical protein [uncultured Roseobacter sp.]|uniref:hypothetical protein n=1 Tax=uncultured Roseobacter sp. TaxID=114847 RepID=UPI00262C7F48|nr:hypothetical protein [uncultured Roseobacter sp.]